MAYGSASAQDGGTDPTPTDPPGDGGGGGNPTQPPGSPTVIKTVPTDGATNVDRDNNIKAKFSEKMLKSTLSMTLAEVSGDGTPSGEVPATVRYKAKKKLLVLNPSVRLAANTTYEARIPDSATDKGGTPLFGNDASGDHVWTFTTGAS